MRRIAKATSGLCVIILMIACTTKQGHMIIAENVDTGSVIKASIELYQSQTVSVGDTVIIRSKGGEFKFLSSYNGWGERTNLHVIRSLNYIKHDIH